MDRALVVVDDVLRRRDLLRRPDEPDLLGDAGALAAGTGASLVVLLVASADDAGADDDRERADRLVAEKLAYFDLDVDVVGPLDHGSGVADRVLAVAEAEGADHVFVAGERRSPTGKAVFGDLAQRLVLGFDGPVTVATR